MSSKSEAERKRGRLEEKLQRSGQCPFLTGGKRRGRGNARASRRESAMERDAESRSVETFSGGGKPSAALQQPAGERER